MASLAEIDDPPPPRSGQRIGCYGAMALLAIIVAGLAVVWFNREGIAGNLIASELAKRGIAATYEVERIGGRRQVLTNIVVGDPQRPDLTVERAEVTIRHRFGFPAISSVRLIRPRLYGTYRDGTLSFGALDPLVFPPEDDEPFALPDLVLAIEGGRGLIESDYGPVGVSLAGAGNLSGGFAGELAATAPGLEGAGCQATRTTLYGRITVASERPGFEGPLRIGRLECRVQGIAAEEVVLQLSGRADKALTAVEGDAGLRAFNLSYGASRLASLGGSTDLSWRSGDLTARYDLTGTDLATPQAAAREIELDGSLRTRRDFERIESDVAVEGAGVRLGPGLENALRDAAVASGDTLVGPLLQQVRSRLAQEGRNSSLVADVTVRRTGPRTSVVVPNATLRGGSGATLLALSRFQFTRTGDASPQFAGNFATGGAGLPRIAGRMQQRPDRSVEARLSMAEYAAGPSRLAVPELVLIQRPDGALGFSGRVRASGALPGGTARNLLLPVSGNWSAAGGLTLWNACTRLAFDQLQVANLTFERRALTLCPARGSPIVSYDGRGLRVAAGAPSLELDGRLGETPIAIRSGPVGLAYPGALSARELLVTLGPAGTSSTFAITNLSAVIGTDIAGEFDGADIRLSAVPLDLLGATGNWRYAQGRLSIVDGAFRLVDRTEAARFNLLEAQGATLTLEDNIITAEAMLREPASGRDVTAVDIVHNLATGRGYADLDVPGLAFGPEFGLRRLTPLDLGVSNLRGTIAGTGRIDWNEAGVTSTGRFSSDSLDFAATFGPVRGASGTIEFSDLLGLTTAPNQKLRVASVNPGIEVLDGEIEIEFRNGEVLALKGATWPFMGGTLTMHPVDITLGAAEERRYIFEIVGLDASRFVEHMELNNISATGTFDGTVPVVFDANGNGKIDGGLLISRPPGGNVAYVGALTYEDMGTVANYTFDTLRSLDYRQMRLQMDGSLIGEIITRVRLDGVSQGAGAERNIITRAIAGIPIRLEVNIRAQFYQLISMTRAIYDPAAIRDPRDLGLLDAQGNVLRTETPGPPPVPVLPEELIPDDAAIQRRESEESP